MILGLGHSRARLFPLSKILDTVIHIVAALVIDIHFLFLHREERTCFFSAYIEYIRFNAMLSK